MIGMLTGRVESVETDTALIDVGGVGYEVRMSATDLSRLHAGQDTRVFTYMNLSQDAITLHGFLDRDAKKTFLQLIKVSGIGPKVAQSLLSTLTPSQLAHAIADNNATALAKAAKERGINLETAAEAYGNHVDMLPDFDLVVLAPQAASYLADLQKDCERVGNKCVACRGKQYIELSQNGDKSLAFVSEQLSK